MKNVKQLREQLMALYEETKDGTRDIDQAKVMVSAANSIIKTASLELEHAKFTGEKKSIEFLK